MLPAPPTRCATAVAILRPLLAAMALVVAFDNAAIAFELDMLPPHAERGLLRVRVQLDDVLPARIEASLARGMPATLHYQTELWRRRSTWFDKLESSLEFSLKIRYDVWSKSYRIERLNAPDLIFARLDSLRMALERPTKLPVAPLERLSQTNTYYVVVTATLKPLTVEDVAEGEDWLSGEVENKREVGLGIITALPRSLFDAMRNFAGLGDLSARQISRDFTLAGLANER